jgi:hypothetical protein
MFASMFESYVLPAPRMVAALDDVALLDAISVATAVETLAVDLRRAVFEEIVRRRTRSTPATRPNLVRPRVALPSSSPRRRRRKARKRRRRH